MAEPEDPAVRSLIDLAAATYRRDRERELTSHPSPEALVEYQERRLEGPQTEAIRAHLVICRHCTEELQRLDDFDSEPDDVPVDETSAAAARGWALFRSRAELDESSARAATVVALPGRRWTRGGSFWAVAASVTFAVIGIGFFVAALQRGPQTTTVAASGSHPFVFDLLPDGLRTRREMTGLEEIAVPAGMDPIVPRLLLGDQTPYPSYSVTVARSSGEAVWHQTDLRRQPSGELALLIPREALQSGDYMINVDGGEAGTPRRLATYSLHIELKE